MTHRCRTIAWSALLGVALLAGVTRPSRAGDPEVARALLQGAREAHDKKKYDEALGLLAKARDEAPELREAAYWMGACLDKKGDVPGALKAYREYRDAIARAEPAAPPTKGELDLHKAALARLTALAPGEAEESRLRAAFATELLALAKTKEAKDPTSALMVLETLVKADPQNAQAAAAIARLRAPAPRKGEAPLPPPFAALKDWRDLIAAQALGDSPNWAYGPSLLTVEVPDQSIPGPPLPITVGTKFAVDVDLRVVSAKVPNWAAGIGLIVQQEGRLVGVALEAKGFAAIQGPVAGPLQPIVNTASPIELGTWHRLTIQVAAPKVVAWLDGKKVSQFAVDGMGPDSHLRLFMNRCKVEFRTLRWAPMP